MRSFLTLLGILFVLGACSRMESGPEPSPAQEQANSYSASPPLTSDQDVRFRPVYVSLTVTEHPLAAYQFELEVISGEATIVGVEGGQIAGFNAPPYYDPAALATGRIIVGAFSTEATIPHGTQRIATIHMQERGQAPLYRVRLMAAADEAGIPQHIEPAISF